MSQRIFYEETEDGKVLEVRTGWDRPLQYHFLTIHRIDSDLGETLFSNLDLKDPGMILPEIESVIRQHTNVSDALLKELITDLREDEARNQGNLLKEYNDNPLAPPEHA